MYAEWVLIRSQDCVLLLDLKAKADQCFERICKAKEHSVYRGWWDPLIVSDSMKIPIIIKTSPANKILRITISIKSTQ